MKGNNYLVSINECSEKCRNRLAAHFNTAGDFIILNYNEISEYGVPFDAVDWDNPFPAAPAAESLMLA